METGASLSSLRFSARIGQTGQVLLCFIDESFKPGLYSFAAVIADEHATKALTADLNRIVSEAAKAFGVSRRAEIHGHPLFHNKDDWEGIGARAQIRIFEQVVDAITTADVTILLRGVDPERLLSYQKRAGYPVRHPAEQVAFQHILQRVDAIAKRRETHALLIADERDDRERHRERFAIYQAEGTPGVYMHTTLDSLLDTVHFAPSHHSRMLQAADILAFTWTRLRTVSERDPRQAAVMTRLEDKIRSSGKVYQEGIWP